MPENDPIFNALAGGGNPNSFYAAGQDPQLFIPPQPPQQPENEQSVPPTVPPVVNPNNDGRNTVVDNDASGDSGTSVSTALNGTEGENEPPTPANPTVTIPQRTMTSELPKVTTYQDLIEEMTPYRTLSPKEIQELRKKQKREAIFAAIGDGIAAISNLYFAGKSGFSNFDGKNALSTVSQKRWEKLWDDYKNNQEKMLTFKMRAMGMDDAAAQAQWNREKAVEDAAISDAVRERAYIDQRNDRKEDIAYRDKAFDRQGEWHTEDNDYRERALRIQEKASRRSGGSSSTPRGVTITYGAGTTSDGKPMNITMSAADWTGNATTLFSLLPQSIRNEIHGDPIMEKDGITGDMKFTGKYNPPTAEQKLEAVWEFLGDGMNYSEGGKSNRTYYNKLVDRLRSVAGLPVDHNHYLP